eukprot:c53374_g1_i1 orf=97-843(-)
MSSGTLQMSSLELDEQTKKRYRKEELVLDDFSGDPWESLSKRVCTLPKAMEQEQHDCSMLDDLYDLVSPLSEGNILESDTQEELVSEMMKSLERVIANEETSSSQSTYGPSSEISLNKSLLEKAQFIQENCGSTKQANNITSIRQSPVDMKFLFEASDDELGIPPSPNSVGENVCCLPEDASWLDTNYPELTEQTLNWQSVSEKDNESCRYSSGHNSWVAEILEMERTIASEVEEENCNLGLSFDSLL